jgi:hypothetical protein
MKTKKKKKKKKEKRNFRKRWSDEGFEPTRINTKRLKN